MSEKPGRPKPTAAVVAPVGRRPRLGTACGLGAVSMAAKASSMAWVMKVQLSTMPPLAMPWLAAASSWLFVSRRIGSSARACASLKPGIALLPSAFTSGVVSLASR